MDRKTATFRAETYEESLKEYTIDQLNEELHAAHTRLEELVAEYQTNKNMIDKFIDNPGFEHLLDMSIANSAKPDDILVAETKVELIENELKVRELA